MPDTAAVEAQAALTATGDTRTDAPSVAEVESKLAKKLEGE